MYLCITPERFEKTTRLMGALKAGRPTSEVVMGRPPPDKEPFVVWGQAMLTMRTVPDAVKRGRPFWVIDNGYWNPAKGSAVGTYRLTYCSMSPVLIPDAPDHRSKPRMKPWRTGRSTQQVVIGLPGLDFGLAIGLNVRAWVAEAETMVRSKTGRRVVVRPKSSTIPLYKDLTNAWALVTHSSNVAVDAVLAGVPVIVAPTNPCAPVGRTDWEVEYPVTPEREPWLNSLSCQQFNIGEMQSGEAWHWMDKITEVYNVQQLQKEADAANVQSTDDKGGTGSAEERDARPPSEPRSKEGKARRWTRGSHNLTGASKVGE